MARPSDCIYCGKPTGSKEHTFPAALGGRRMSKGILCGGCNGRFSALDEELSGQLREVNGVLGVRGDHADDARPALATSPADGAVFEIDGSGRPRLSEPLILGDEIVNGQRHLRVRVSDERQRQDFIAGLIDLCFG